MCTSCSTLQYPAVPCSPHLQYPQYPFLAVPTVPTVPCSTHGYCRSTQLSRLAPAVPTVPTVPCSTRGYCAVPRFIHSTRSTCSTLQYPWAVPTVPGLPQYPRLLCSTRQGNHLDRVIGSFRDAVQEPVDTLFFGRGVKGVVV